LDLEAESQQQRELWLAGLMGACRQAGRTPAYHPSPLQAATATPSATQPIPSSVVNASSPAVYMPPAPISSPVPALSVQATPVSATPITYSSPAAAMAAVAAAVAAGAAAGNAAAATQRSPSPTRNGPTESTMTPTHMPPAPRGLNIHTGPNSNPSITTMLGGTIRVTTAPGFHSQSLHSQQSNPSPSPPPMPTTSAPPLPLSLPPTLPSSSPLSSHTPLSSSSSSRNDDRAFSSAARARSKSPPPSLMRATSTYTSTSAPPPLIIAPVVDARTAASFLPGGSPSSGTRRLAAASPTGSPFNNENNGTFSNYIPTLTTREPISTAAAQEKADIMKRRLEEIDRKLGQLGPPSDELMAAVRSPPASPGFGSPPTHTFVRTPSTNSNNMSSPIPSSSPSALSPLPTDDPNLVNRTPLYLRMGTALPGMATKATGPGVASSPVPRDSSASITNTPQSTFGSPTLSSLSAFNSPIPLMPMSPAINTFASSSSSHQQSFSPIPPLSQSFQPTSAPQVPISPQPPLISRPTPIAVASTDTHINNIPASPLLLGATALPSDTGRLQARIMELELEVMNERSLRQRLEERSRIETQTTRELAARCDIAERARQVADRKCAEWERNDADMRSLLDERDHDAQESIKRLEMAEKKVIQLTNEVEQVRIKLNKAEVAVDEESAWRIRLQEEVKKSKSVQSSLEEKVQLYDMNGNGSHATESTMTLQHAELQWKMERLKFEESLDKIETDLQHTREELTMKSKQLSHEQQRSASLQASLDVTLPYHTIPSLFLS
jgi:hypothetical protein